MTAVTNSTTQPISDRRIDYVIKRYGLKLLQAIVADSKNISVMVADDGKHSTLHVGDRAVNESPWIDYRFSVVLINDTELVCIKKNNQRMAFPLNEFNLDAIYEECLMLLTKHDLNGKATIWLLDRYVEQDFLFEDLTMVHEELKLFKKIYPDQNLDHVKTRKSLIEKIAPQLLSGSSIGARYDKLSQLTKGAVSISRVNTPNLIGYVYFLNDYVASKVFTQCTRWCTTTSDSQFRHYSTEGLVVIDVIHTVTKEQFLSQLSPSSSNWLNEKDSAMSSDHLKHAIAAIKSMEPVDVGSSYQRIKREITWWTLHDSPRDKSEIVETIQEGKRLIQRLTAMCANADEPLDVTGDPIEILNRISSDLGLPEGTDVWKISNACDIDPKSWLQDLKLADCRFALKNVITKMSCVDDRIAATLELIKGAINSSTLSGLCGNVSGIKQQNIEMMFDYYLTQVVTMQDIVRACTSMLHEEVESIRIRRKASDRQIPLDLFSSTRFGQLFVAYCYARGYTRLDPKHQLTLTCLVLFGSGSGHVSEIVRHVLIDRFYDTNAMVGIDRQCSDVPQYVNYNTVVAHINPALFGEYDIYVESPQVEVLIAAYIRAYLGVHGGYDTLVSLLSGVKPARIKQMIQKLGTSITMFEFARFPQQYADDIDSLFNKCVELSSPPHGTPTHWLTINLSHYDKLIILLALGYNLYQRDDVEVHSMDHEWLNIGGTLFKDVPEFQAAAFNMVHNKVMNREVFAKNVQCTINSIAQQTQLDTSGGGLCMEISMPGNSPTPKHKDVRDNMSLFIQRLVAYKNAKITIPVTGVVSSPEWFERIDERFTDVYDAQVKSHEAREARKMASKTDVDGSPGVCSNVCVIDYDDVATQINYEAVRQIIQDRGMTMSHPASLILFEALNRR